MSRLSSILVQSLLLMRITTTNGSFGKPPNVMSCHVIQCLSVWFHLFSYTIFSCVVLLHVAICCGLFCTASHSSIHTSSHSLDWITSCSLAPEKGWKSLKLVFLIDTDTFQTCLFWLGNVSQTKKKTKPSKYPTKTFPLCASSSDWVVIVTPWSLGFSQGTGWKNRKSWVGATLNDGGTRPRILKVISQKKPPWHHHISLFNHV